MKEEGRTEPEPAVPLPGPVLYLLHPSSFIVHPSVNAPALLESAAQPALLNFSAQVTGQAAPATPARLSHPGEPQLGDADPAGEADVDVAAFAAGAGVVVAGAVEGDRQGVGVERADHDVGVGVVGGQVGEVDVPHGAGLPGPGQQVAEDGPGPGDSAGPVERLAAASVLGQGDG